MRTERHDWRTGLAIVTCALLMAACAPAQQTREPGAEQPDVEADEQAVLEMHRKLIAAYQEGSIDGVTWLLSSSPDLVIFHPRTRSRFDGMQEAREGLLAMFGKLEDAEWTEVHTALSVNGSVAWITSDVLIEAPALATPFLGRGTEIWVREEGGWRLAHGHWSPTPGAMEG